MNAAVSTRKKTRTIKQIQKLERPREKLIRYGAERLTDAELLAIVLRSGRRGQNVVELASNIIKTFELAELSSQSLKQLQTMPGIGPAKACEILACCALSKRIASEPLSGSILTAQDVWRAVSDINDQKKRAFCGFVFK